MVKCKDCGLLGVRSRLTSTIYEYTRTMYERGTFNDGGRPFIPAIECCAEAADLHGETDDGGSTTVVRAAVDKERECDAFVKRIVGRTPMEHQDMKWQQLAADTQNRIADIHNELLAWQKEQAEKDDHFAKQLQALEELRHQETRRDSWAATRMGWWAIAAGIVSGLLTSLIAAWLT